MPPWGQKFLLALRDTPNVSAAAEYAGIGRTTAYDARRVHPDFAAGWDDAIDRSLDELEQSVFRRAKETSDTLAIFLLKSHRPATYGERLKIEHSGEIEIGWGDPQGDDAPAASGPVGGEAASGPVQGPGVRPEVGED